MAPEALRKLLERLQAGDASVEDAMTELKKLPFSSVEHGTVDHHRALRQGVPEVIFGERKSAAQIVGLAKEIARAGHNVLVTRIDPDKAGAVARELDGFAYVPEANAGRLVVAPVPTRPIGYVAVITAGTSDVSVAEEAVITLEAVGLPARRLYDVGVAGLHRLMHRVDELTEAAAVIAIAGMEGALPSVVGGIVACPVVAVPTSVGYGSALGGFTALLSMLTSCANGVVVVNIDSGFGAAMAVHRILHRSVAHGQAAAPRPGKG